MRKALVRLAYCYVPKPGQFTRLLVQRPAFRFSSINTEKFEFKTETKKLLDIVAKSLYTDKDVFIRELLSNASDALEKQRFLASAKGIDIEKDLTISITLDENKRTITLEDTGVGMTRQEMIDNLGTIARSGSKQFLEQNNTLSSDKIIGQFGVGFYSSFIVGDTVEVTSKSDSSGKTHTWTSDGTGTFTITEVNDEFQGRGTKIVIHLKPEMSDFVKKSEVSKIIQRYSNFIAFPITINGEQLNFIQAIWSRNKSEITEEDYTKFYEYLSNSKMSYKYKLHYSTDAPLSIKSLLYVPSSHMEKFGMQMEEFDVHLYSKKVLIKKNCRELLPNYLRFVKGVVDCEDLPLNISREHYQDTALIAKLKSIITKRLLKELETFANKDTPSYLAWYNEFQQFIKEGIATDDDNKEQLTKLLRFQTNKSEEFISLDQYIKLLPAGENSIYFYLAPTRNQALNSPYMEPYQNSNIPVILTYSHIDEMVFKQINIYDKKTFINVETESPKHVNKDQPEQQGGIPAEELSPTISQVEVSRRLKNSPAIVTSSMSSGMRQVMQAMGQSNDDLFKNMTLEINPAHEIFVQVNKLRKTNQQVASLVSKQVLDNCLLSAGLMRDPKVIVDRSNQVLALLLQQDIKSSDAKPEPISYREEKQEEQLDEEIIIDEQGNPKVVKKQK